MSVNQWIHSFEVYQLPSTNREGFQVYDLEDLAVLLRDEEMQRVSSRPDSIFSPAVLRDRLAN